MPGESRVAGVLTAVGSVAICLNRGQDILGALDLVGVQGFPGLPELKCLEVPAG